MAEQWLSIVEYARTYQVSDMTIRRRIKTGKLHAVLKEGKYYIPVPVDGRTQMTEAVRQELSGAHDTAQNSALAKRSASSEMTVVKGHPSAYKTLAGQGATQEARTQPPAFSSRSFPPDLHQRHDLHDLTEAEFGVQEGILPSSLKRPMLQNETSLVDTRALLAFCEASVKRFSENERRVVEKFKAKLEALEATLGSKDQEIKTLRQQTEDLQLLVKILERKLPTRQRDP